MHHILSDPTLVSVPGSSLEFICLSEVSGGIFRKYSHDLDAEKVQEGTEELLSLSDHIVAAGHFPGLLIPGASPEDGAREILRLTDLLDAVHDEEDRRERRRELDYKLMKFNMMRRRPVNLEGLPEYRDRVEEKLSRGG